MKKSRIIRMVEISLICALIISAGVFIAASAASSADIRQSLVRLHIRARSDSDEDQAVKLIVRDAVLEGTREAMAGCDSAAAAREYICANTDFIEELANRALKQAGAHYGASARFEQSWFPTREYGGVTLPAGTYDSLVIELGGGAGENWWCVMFPTLCYQGDSFTADSAALDYFEDRLSPADYAAIAGDGKPQYEVRFKVLDFFGWLLGDRR